MIAQAVKRYARRRVKEILRRVVVGTEEAVEARLESTQGSVTAVINTAYIERLQATFRSRLSALVRRTRTAARQKATLEAGMWLVGTVYNFCRAHRSLRLAGDSAAQRRWIERTPAEAAELTDHCWSVYELLSFAIPRLRSSGAGDDRDGCWRLLMQLEYSPRLNGVLPTAS